MVAMTWGQLIWVFFPIPIFSLVLLSIPGPRKLEKFGNDLVHRIFFTKISLGSIYITLFHLFILSGLVIFANSVHQVKLGAAGFHCHSCRYEAETYWYKKAMKFRCERNFWLSLFNVILWFLVWRIHNLKGRVIRMKEAIRNLEIEVVAARADDETKVKVEVTVPKTEEMKKKE